MLIFQKSNIRHYPLFLESYFFRGATFSKDVIFYSTKTYYTATLPIYQLVNKWALYQYYFLSKILFQSLHFSRIRIFSKQLYFFARAIFSEDVIFLNC